LPITPVLATRAAPRLLIGREVRPMLARYVKP